MNIHDMFPSRWLTSHDLGNKLYTLKIRNITVEEMRNAKGQREDKYVLWFEKAKKGLVLNKTNTFIIADMYGEDTDQWKGQLVTVYATVVRAFGEDRLAIRVLGTIPSVEFEIDDDDDEPVPDHLPTPPALVANRDDPFTE